MAVARPYGFEIDFVRNPFSWSAAWFFVIILKLIFTAIFDIKIHEEKSLTEKISFPKPDFDKPGLAVRCWGNCSIRVGSNLYDDNLSLILNKSDWNVKPYFLISWEGYQIKFRFYPYIAGIWNFKGLNLDYSKLTSFFCNNFSFAIIFPRHFSSSQFCWQNIWPI